jgi:ribonuclease HII
MEKIINKLKRVSDIPPQMNFETKTWSDRAYLCGIDEVGRGCLAGPVVTSAVILKPYRTHPLLVDSKILTEKKRLLAAAWIKDNAWYSFGIIDARKVDTCNIYKATQKAMRKALYGLFSMASVPQPQHILIDAMPLSLHSKFENMKISSFTKGESKSISIAAASILAKVMRDELMKRMEHVFPGYHFNSNKGYGAPQHLKTLEQHKHCLIHRKTFLKKHQIGDTHDESSAQTSLF